MSDFTSVDDIVLALANVGTGIGGRSILSKSSITTASNNYYSLWAAAGYPAAGVAPGAVNYPSQGTAGCWMPGLVDPTTETLRLLQTELAMSVAGQLLIIYDRVVHMSGLSGTSVASQTIGCDLTGPASQGRCMADGSDVLWFYEWYTATGGTGVTGTTGFSWGTSGNSSVNVSIPANAPANRMIPILTGANTPSIKSINSVTLSATTGTAGNFGVTGVKVLAVMGVSQALVVERRDWALSGMPKVGSGACLCGMMLASGTSSGSVTGTIIVGGK